MSGVFTVRRARLEDAREIAECEREVWSSLRGLLPRELVEGSVSHLEKPSAVAEIAQRIRSPDRIVLVADWQGKVVGVARGARRPDGTFWLSFLGVRPAYRRKGVGSALLEAFIAEARKASARKLALLTYPTLKGATRLYFSKGFVSEGTLHGYFHGADLVRYVLFLTCSQSRT